MFLFSFWFVDILHNIPHLSPHETLPCNAIFVLCVCVREERELERQRKKERKRKRKRERVKVVACGSFSCKLLSFVFFTISLAI